MYITHNKSIKLKYRRTHVKKIKKKDEFGVGEIMLLSFNRKNLLLKVFP